MSYFRGALALAAVVASLLLAGCATDANIQLPAQASAAVTLPAPATATPGPSSSAAAHSIPETTNRPSDPPLPSDYNQSTNNQLTPQEASLSQLWAAADSEVGTDAGASTFGGAAGLTDFSAAITSRCYPILSADQVTELEQLRAAYESATGTAGFAAAQEYFVRATDSCM